MKQREIERNIVHIIIGLVLVILLWSNLLTSLYLLYLIWIGLLVSFVSKYYDIPVLSYFLRKFERPAELNRFPGKGIIFYLIGAYVVVLLFPRDIALASIMILALGDGVSTIFGLRYGKVAHPFSDKKYLEGMFAGIIAGFLGASLFIPFTLAFIAAAVAMLLESFEFHIRNERVDDNLIIPIVAAVTILVFRIFLG